MERRVFTPIKRLSSPTKERIEETIYNTKVATVGKYKEKFFTSLPLYSLSDWTWPSLVWSKKLLLSVCFLSGKPCT
jgi:hypothetical protein